ncbi:hypothetical protein BDQ12DRAFT_574237, partial [Crucibulum laeve]
LLLQSGLPTKLWAEAICFSIWLHNCSYTLAVDTLKTPHQLATGEKPDLSLLHCWGSKVLVKNLDAGKLESCVHEG